MITLISMRVYPCNDAESCLAITRDTQSPFKTPISTAALKRIASAVEISSWNHWDIRRGKWVTEISNRVYLRDISLNTAFLFHYVYLLSDLAADEVTPTNAGVPFHFYLWPLTSLIWVLIHVCVCLCICIWECVCMCVCVRLFIHFCSLSLPILNCCLCG